MAAERHLPGFYYLGVVSPAHVKLISRERTHVAASPPRAVQLPYFGEEDFSSGFTPEAFASPETPTRQWGYLPITGDLDRGHQGVSTRRWAMHAAR